MSTHPLRPLALALLVGAFVVACTPDEPPAATDNPPAASAAEGEPAPRAGTDETSEDDETASGTAEGSSAGAGAAEGEEAATSDGAGEAEAEAAPRWNAAGSHAPLDAATRARVWGTPEDAHPEQLDASRSDLVDRHYLYSDEENHGVLYPHLRDLGGAYMGVGTDQIYLFAGWMRPELAFATDYDPWVRELHFAYLAAFERCDDIDCFLAFWANDARDSSRALLRERYADHPELELLLHVHHHAARLVDRRMRRIRRMGRAWEVPTFVTDEATYAFVRDLARAGRIRPAVINLLDDTGLTSLSEMLGEVGVPLRALYISNAEEYWSYSDQFRANIAAQNFDERSFLIRTSAAKPDNNDYRYYLQPGLNFQAWLREPWVRSYRDIFSRDTVRDPEHIPFRILDAPPAPRR